MDYSLEEKQLLYQGFVQLERYLVSHQRFDGGRQRIVRENLERGDAVAVLLYDPKADETLLIEQFRIGPAVRGDQPWLVEIVAGMLDADESPETAAIREAEEEAGYRPYAIRPLGRYYSTPGGSSERIHLFLGLVDKRKPVGAGGGVDHEKEDIRCFWLPRRQAMQWVSEGRIHSAAPMLAMLLAFGCEGAVSRR